jgi:hypothetical protein
MMFVVRYKCRIFSGNYAALSKLFFLPRFESSVFEMRGRSDNHYTVMILKCNKIKD